MFAGRVDPGEVSEVRVGGSCDELAADLAEVVRALRERDDLRRTDKCAADTNIHVIINKV